MSRSDSSVRSISPPCRNHICCCSVRTGFHSFCARAPSHLLRADHASSLFGTTQKKKKLLCSRSCQDVAVSHRSRLLSLSLPWTSLFPARYDRHGRSACSYPERHPRRQRPPCLLAAESRRFGRHFATLARLYRHGRLPVRDLVAETCSPRLQVPGPLYGAPDGMVPALHTARVVIGTRVGG